MLSAVECYKCLEGLPRAPQRDVMSTRATREDHWLPASEFISFLVFVSKSSGFDNNNFVKIWFLIIWPFCVKSTKYG